MFRISTLVALVTILMAIATTATAEKNVGAIRGLKHKSDKSSKKKGKGKSSSGSGSSSDESASSSDESASSSDDVLADPPTSPPADPPTNPPVDPPTEPSTPVSIFNFASKFKEGSSVSYSGQTARQILINCVKKDFGSKTTNVLSCYDCKDDGCDDFATGLTLRDNLSVKQATIGDISGGKNLNSKIAGNDSGGQHKNWETDFVGFDFDFIVDGVSQPKTPENLVRYWAKQLEESSGATGKAYVTELGQDLQQLVQKFLLGAVNFSQGADDYLDNDIDGKGLKSSNIGPSKDGSAYTSLEHVIDEGFGYFGAAMDMFEYTDDELAGKGGRVDWQIYHDTNNDSTIDIKSEINLGHSQNAAKRDRSAVSGTVDLTSQAYEGFYLGRKIVADANGALTDDEMMALEGHISSAVEAWEKAIVSTVIHYINDVIGEMNKSSDNYDFFKHAIVWSEMKGFALSMQFNPKSPLDSEEFAFLHQLMRDSPELDRAQFHAYEGRLMVARNLLRDAYGFSVRDAEEW